MNLIVMASGPLGGAVLSELLKTDVSVKAILTDGQSENIKNIAQQRSIPLFVGNPRKGIASSFLSSHQITVDLGVSINYLYIVEEDLFNYPSFGSINIHGSLLPEYRGRAPHIWAIINGEKETGVTVHYISEGCDQGNILLQEKVVIGPNTSGGALIEKFNEMYPRMIIEVINMFDGGKPEGILQDEAKATSFPKRTPEDGQIDWSWQRERVERWIRALRPPYPGAFSFLGEKKIFLIDSAIIDLSFEEVDQNGKILAIDNHWASIKTPNGVLKVRSADCAFRNDDIGKVLV